MQGGKFFQRDVETGNLEPSLAESLCQALPSNPRPINPMRGTTASFR